MILSLTFVNDRCTRGNYSAPFLTACGAPEVPSNTMIDSEFDKPNLRPESKQGPGQNERQTQSPSEAEVLLELFNLLEQYAPMWYAEEHHNRAVAALRSPPEVPKTPLERPM